MNQAQQVEALRQGFEKWARSRRYALGREEHQPEHYEDDDTQIAWHAWQGCAADQLAAAPQAVQAAAQPAAQGMEAEIQQAVEAERERICAAIKAEDDHCVDQGDYMLDSNDCIKIVRGKWVRPDYSLDAAQAKQGGA